MNMFVSVAICTWNRAGLLDQSLTSMHNLQIPPQTDWELIIVNNNCTDTTDDVISKHEAILPIRRLFEPQQGKTYALNLASQAAKGEYIIWTDDDVLIDPDWIAFYVEAFKQWPESSIFGGPVKPFLVGNPPRWLMDALVISRVGDVYAAIDFGQEPIRLNRGQEPYGVNWAVRTKEQRKYLYDTTLGPDKGSKIGYEETDVIQRMFADGLEGRWVPNAWVTHYIPENRQTIKYIRKYHTGLGERKALQIYGNNKCPSFEEKTILIKIMIKSRLKYWIYRLINKKSEIWIRQLINYCHAWGQLKRK
jgi:glycosyltransferase involved in cell wall biosynthesis